LPESLELTAYHKIKSDVTSAVFTPGMLLSENEISATLGISRTPVHSAIVRLVKEGYLESLPKRGFMVKDISFAEFYNMHETIVSMEFYALARIKSSPNPIDMGELERNLEAQISAQKTGDNNVYYMAGFDFATTILKSTNNRTMLEVTAQFRDKLFCKVLNFRKTHPEFKPNLSKNRNEKVFEALASGNIVQAQAELLNTMTNVWEFIQDRSMGYSSSKDATAR
jgi:DNA-binding GntR family transcriptional regulator